MFIFVNLTFVLIKPVQAEVCQVGILSFYKGQFFESKSDEIIVYLQKLLNSKGYILNLDENNQYDDFLIDAGIRTSSRSGEYGDLNFLRPLNGNLQFSYEIFDNGYVDLENKTFFFESSKKEYVIEQVLSSIPHCDKVLAQLSTLDSIYETKKLNKNYIMNIINNNKSVVFDYYDKSSTPYPSPEKLDSEMTNYLTKRGFDFFIKSNQNTDSYFEKVSFVAEKLNGSLLDITSHVLQLPDSKFSKEINIKNIIERLRNAGIKFDPNVNYDQVLAQVASNTICMHSVPNCKYINLTNLSTFEDNVTIYNSLIESYIQYFVPKYYILIRKADNSSNKNIELRKIVSIDVNYRNDGVVTINPEIEVININWAGNYIFEVQNKLDTFFGK